MSKKSKAIVSPYSSKVTRRHFLATTAAAATAFAIVPGCGSASKASSSFGGVQIGTISYSFRSLPSSAEDILGYLVKLGINSVELMGAPIEQFAGIPPLPPRVRGGGGRGFGGGQAEAPELSPEEQAAQDLAREEAAAARTAAQEEQRLWRLSPPMEKFAELRKMYNDEGINIRIAKLGNPSWSDEEIDYSFNVALALGAIGTTMEIGTEAAERMGPFAAKQDLYAIFHNHGQPGEEGFSFDPFLEAHPSNMLNLDVGHYFGATGLSPVPLIERLHDRIASLHFKDKTGPHPEDPDNGNQNRVWGEGETPLRDILNLLKREGWPIVPDIELEYPVPEDSDVLTEMARCVDYCRDVLA